MSNQGSAPPPQGRPQLKHRSLPPIDTTEYGHDLHRQNHEFVRARTAEYFELYSRAAKRLTQPSSYARGDLVTDVSTLWSMMARDIVEAGLRSVRTVNHVAADNPVPAHPYRRAEKEVEVAAVARFEKDTPMHLRCSELVHDHDDGKGRDVIGAAEVEISPNPLMDAASGGKVVLAVNAAAPEGTYKGRLLCFGTNPKHPIQTVAVSIDVPAKFSRA